MPRDAAPPNATEVELPGNRRGRLVHSDDAGSFRIVLRGATWLTRLADVGWIDATQRDAGETLGRLFEDAGIRPPLTITYQPTVDGVGDDDFLERLSAVELRAWRQLHRLLGACPLPARSTVEDVALWDKPPHSVKLLQQGLSAVARAIRQPRRR